MMKTTKFLSAMALGALLALSVFAFTDVASNERRSIDQPNLSDPLFSDPSAQGNPTGDPCLRWDSVCCEAQTYCPVTRDQVMTGIRNYRDFDWKFSSPYYRLPVRAGLEEYNGNMVQHRMYTSGDPSHFDSRYLDIDIDELSNYLCNLKNCEAVEKPNTIRFYYIRYPDIGSSEFPMSRKKLGKHSLALVPTLVQRDSTTREILANIEFSDNQDQCFDMWMPEWHAPRDGCDRSMYQNHNHICPPYDDCGDLAGTLMHLVDTSTP